MGFPVLIMNEKTCNDCFIRDDLIAKKNIKAEEAINCSGECGALGMICTMSTLDTDKKPYYSQETRKMNCQDRIDTNKDCETCVFHQVSPFLVPKLIN